MPQYTNLTNVPLSVAVFLATDHYDHDPTAISATALLKPIRQVVLAPRVPEAQAPTDITQLVKSRLGTAIHDGIEKAWVGHYERAMRALGYPQEIINRVVINPDPDNLPEDAIPVYMEQRAYREIDGRRVSGKYDFVAEGRIEDFKSTSTFTWTKGKKDKDYQLQGSIYRWLNPKIVTEAHMAIQFFFMDWMAGRAAEPNYPSRQVEQKLIPLLPLDETEEFIRDRLRLFDRYKNADQSDIPLCTDDELWRSEPQFKYYKNPEKLTRSTKNFDNAAEAYQRKATDGNVGVVVEIPGQVKACNYCAAFPVCTQKDQLIADGSLQI